MITHLSYLIMKEHLVIQWIAIIPLVFFGLGHALFTTLLSPTVPLLIDNNAEILNICFSIIKCVEGFSITFFTQIAGWTRQTSGSYTYVTALLILCNLLALMACYELAYPMTFTAVG